MTASDIALQCPSVLRPRQLTSHAEEGIEACVGLRGPRSAGAPLGYIAQDVPLPLRRGLRACTNACVALLFSSVGLLFSGPDSESNVVHDFSASSDDRFSFMIPRCEKRAAWFCAMRKSAGRSLQTSAPKT